MQDRQDGLLARAASALTVASLASVLFSIAVCHILMALALAALLLSGKRFRFPPIKLPLALFLAGTVLSLAFSAEPMAGRPQLRKFFVWLVLLLIASTIQSEVTIRRLASVWAAIATASSLVGLHQFYAKLTQARSLGVPFYQYYVSDRITGFMSHWMTFGGQLMLVSLLLVSLFLFGPARRWQRWWLACCVTIAGLGILAGFTRSIWLATACGLGYLFWNWRRWTVTILPVVAAVLLAVNPASIRDRALSILRPHGELDSNQHRIVSWRIGWNIIRAHPWLGIGPEHIKLHYQEYVPADVPRPLPEGWYGHLHNIYLHYAAERGIPTLLALLWLLGRMLADFRKGLRQATHPEARWILHGAVAAWVAVLVEGFFELNLGDTEVLTVFLAIAGFAYVALETTSGQVGIGRD